jgi:hypothetical protein
MLGMTRFEADRSVPLPAGFEEVSGVECCMYEVVELGQTDDGGDVLEAT